ncbi:MAG: exodeoxyribonuclease III [Gammaproteobacteria bacterium]|nr:exodeoxyribonuclease III [Gammaproteobacteria bacterium]
MPTIATWNVNSLRARLPLLLSWSAATLPDIIALQETKVPDEDFPGEAIGAAGYHALYAGQKTFNGVATLARSPGELLGTELPGFADPQRRVLLTRHGELRLLNLYVPNGAEVGSDKYRYKLAWLDALIAHVGELLRAPEPLIVLGDFNIAPEDRDVHDPKAWEGSVLVSPPERERYFRLLALGLVDVFRLFPQPDGAYSWWDYRAAGFRRNLGLRIDLVLASPAAAAACRGCVIDREPRGWERPSDHTPVLATFA